ncbi:hypothetical protein [Geomicrobium sp. JCM 19038]|uniref:hypothetical protein n=1 Tax=Geomicrobium sp. JCM 19038 TaxID=1460635 RepID=UPI00045F2C88|nr:hypothetical protein [Geomicrobium sp. JCM 19038]GAK09603.1 hypothetical protein JCM19038_3445 [Geomicrobium sp. JCM 19038]
MSKQQRIGQVIELIAEAQKEASEFGVLWVSEDLFTNKLRVQMHAEDLMKLYPEFKVKNRECDEYPHEVFVNLGSYYMFGIMDAEKHQRLIKEAVTA